MQAYPRAEFALLLVLGLHTRVELDELRGFGLLANVFGRRFYDRSMIVWTHGDLLAKNEGLSSYLAGAGVAVTAFG